MTNNNYQEYIDYPKKYFDIDFEYGFVKCKDCDWSPEYPHSHIENTNMYKTCQYINSKYNIKFDKKTGEKIGFIKPEKLNLTCPICLDKKYCVEGYFDCNHHVCNECYSSMKTKPIKLHVPRRRHHNEQFNEDHLIINCPLCRSE